MLKFGQIYDDGYLEVIDHDNTSVHTLIQQGSLKK